METAARISSKGQVTVPKAVREALGLTKGDPVVFRVQDHQVTLAAAPDFLDLAGTVSVPAAKRNATWDDVIRRTHVARASRRP
jgi:AbrB family looped-hinge helix DNA binding protein